MVASGSNGLRPLGSLTVTDAHTIGALQRSKQAQAMVGLPTIPLT